MLSEQVVATLDALIQTIRKKQFELTLAQRQVLSILAEHKAINLSELAKLRGVKKSSMSVMMSQLIDQQYVVRGYAKSDRRQRLYLLSRSGKEILVNDRQQYQSWLNKRLAVLSQDEQEKLLDILQRLQP